MYTCSWFTLLCSRNEHSIVKQLLFVSSLSHVQLFATPWTVAHQTPLSVEFYRQGYWRWWPFPSPRDLLNSGTEPVSLALAGDSWPLSHQGSQRKYTPMKINQNKTRHQHVTRLLKTFQWRLITHLNKNSLPSTKVDGLAPFSFLLAYHSLPASLWVSHWDGSVWTNTPKPFCLKILDLVVSSAWKVFPWFSHIWLLSAQILA